MDSLLGCTTWTKQQQLHLTSANLTICLCLFRLVLNLDVGPSLLCPIKYEGLGLPSNFIHSQWEKREFNDFPNGIYANLTQMVSADISNQFTEFIFFTNNLLPLLSFSRFFVNEKSKMRYLKKINMELNCSLK